MGNRLFINSTDNVHLKIILNLIQGILHEKPWMNSPDAWSSQLELTKFTKRDNAKVQRVYQTMCLKK